MPSEDSSSELFAPGAEAYYRKVLKLDEPEREECEYDEHPFRPFQGPKDEPGKPHCLTCGHIWGDCSWHWVKEDEEPPLTPEEEEEVACMYKQDGCRFPLTNDCEHGCRDAADELTRLGQEMEEPPPPQPTRRPPYAVAYSVGGHPYELNLPGDAEVLAVDGVLIIRHALGPVAGIVQVLPIESKESSP